MTGRVGPTSPDGCGDAEGIEHTEALLTRLGRREPSLADLDDPVAAALAELAGDVDLAPVPVAVTRRALALAGHRPELPVPVPSSPPFTSPAPSRTTRSEVGRSEAARSGVTPAAVVRDAPVVSPRRAPDVRSRPGARPAAPVRRGTPGAGPGAPTRARVVRVRSPLGLVAAAVLVVLGGGVSTLATGVAPGPVSRVTSVVQRWAPGSDGAARRHLTAQLEAARTALREGRPQDAARLVRDVRQQLGTLGAAEQQVRQDDLAREIAVLEGQLQADAARVGESLSPVPDGPAVRSGGASGAASPAASPTAPARVSAGGSRGTPAPTSTPAPTTTGTVPSGTAPIGTAPTRSGRTPHGPHGEDGSVLPGGQGPAPSGGSAGGPGGTVATPPAGTSPTASNPSSGSPTPSSPAPTGPATPGGETTTPARPTGLPFPPFGQPPGTPSGTPPVSWPGAGPGTSSASTSSPGSSTSSPGTTASGSSSTSSVAGPAPSSPEAPRSPSGTSGSGA